VFRFQATHALLDLGPSGGVPGPEADLRLWGEDGTVKIHLDGGSGDIRLAGADCAEDFDADESKQFDPGSVMTIGVGGRIRPCTEAYDHRVAGVVSGAGGFRSGIVMDSRHGRRRTPVALSGKVYCRVDAGYAPVEAGDLPTTSATLGHAMKATDPSRAFGAILGKALQPLGTGTALIPILSRSSSASLTSQAAWEARSSGLGMASPWRSRCTARGRRPWCSSMVGRVTAATGVVSCAPWRRATRPWRSISPVMEGRVWAAGPGPWLPSAMMSWPWSNSWASISWC